MPHHRMLWVEEVEVESFVRGTRLGLARERGLLDYLPAPVANAWVESDVPTECGFRYVRDANIVIAKLEKQLAAVAGAVSMLDVPTVIPELEE